MKFSVPYTPGLLEFFRNNRDIIGDRAHDIYFSDNRFHSNRHFDWDPEYWDELRAIRDEFGAAIHYVINPSVYDNQIYLPKGVEQFVDLLRSVWADGATMLTFNNSILLRLGHLRDSIPPFIIKNSVNNKAATLESVAFWHEDIGLNDVILDRSLNRNEDELNRILEYTRPRGITITLLANEGCLPGCQWKQHCDNMISQYDKHVSNEISTLRHVHGILACTNHYQMKPAELFKSPFMMPNMIDHYSQWADVVKIVGRMVDINVLGDIILSYFTGSGNINLSHYFATQVSPVMQNISFNDLAALEFGEKTKNCKNECMSCNFCDKVMDQLMLEKHGVKTSYAKRPTLPKSRT